MAVACRSVRDSLRLVIRHSDVADKQSLAKTLGRSVKTLDSWSTGGGNSAPDTIPGESYDRLVAILARSVMELDEASIRDLLRRDPAALDAEIEAARAPSLESLIAQEADTTRFRVIAVRRSLGALQFSYRERDLDPQAHIPLRQWFRLECPAPLAGRHVFAIRHLADRWTPVASSFSPEQSVIHIPGCDTTGAPAAMREDSETGIHRFVVLQTIEPAPLLARQALDASAQLDIRTLAHLAAHYAKQRRSQRRLFLLRLQIGDISSEPGDGAA